MSIKYLSIMHKMERVDVVKMFEVLAFLGKW